MFSIHKQIGMLRDRCHPPPLAAASATLSSSMHIISCSFISIITINSIVSFVSAVAVVHWTTQQPFFLFFFSSMTTWLADVGPGTTCFETWARDVTPLFSVGFTTPPPVAAAAVGCTLWEPFVPFCADWFCDTYIWIKCKACVILSNTRTSSRRYLHWFLLYLQ